MLHQVEDERKQLDLKRVFSFLKMSLFSPSNQDQQPNNLVLLDHFCQKLLLSILIFSVFKVYYDFSSISKKEPAFHILNMNGDYKTVQCQFSIFSYFISGMTALLQNLPIIF